MAEATNWLRLGSGPWGRMKAVKDCDCQPGTFIQVVDQGTQSELQEDIDEIRFKLDEAKKGTSNQVVDRCTQTEWQEEFDDNHFKLDEAKKGTSVQVVDLWVSHQCTQTELQEELDDIRLDEAKKGDVQCSESVRFAEVGRGAEAVGEERSGGPVHLRGFGRTHHQSKIKCYICKGTHKAEDCDKNVNWDGLIRVKCMRCKTTKRMDMRRLVGEQGAKRRVICETENCRATWLHKIVG